MKILPPTTMNPLLKLHFSLMLAALVSMMGGCATSPSGSQGTVRSMPPVRYEAAITNYFDATAGKADATRELVISAPQPGGCSARGSAGGYVGWVVPVQVKTTRAVQQYFFWFGDEVIRGVTRRIEDCP